jgi:ATP-dependent DNA helicase RecG
MRPEILYILFNPLTQVKGIGKVTLQKLCKLGCTRLIDLLFHLPYSFIDRRYSPSIPNAIAGKTATFKVTINHHEPPKKRNSPYKIICSNETGFLYLVFFKGQEQYLKSELPEGSVRIISGKVEFFNDTLQITHPDYIGKEEDEALIKKIEPIYPLTANLSNKVAIKYIQEALKSVPNLRNGKMRLIYKAKAGLVLKNP